MRVSARGILAIAALAAVGSAAQMAARAQDRGSGNLQAEARQIFSLANEARTQAGIRRLDWDPALAAAALKHCGRRIEARVICRRRRDRFFRWRTRRVRRRESGGWIGIPRWRLRP